MGKTKTVEVPTKTVEVPERFLQHCAIKAAVASALTREETQNLMNWCSWQTEDLWNDLSLQEILNVYRASAEWDTWEGWSEDDRPAAHSAWNNAVTNPGNKMAA